MYRRRMGVDMWSVKKNDFRHGTQKAESHSRMMIPRGFTLGVRSPVFFFFSFSLSTYNSILIPISNIYKTWDMLLTALQQFRV
jgi:hypothetical protein